MGAGTKPQSFRNDPQLSMQVGYPYDMNGITLDHHEKVGILPIYCWYIQGML